MYIYIYKERTPFSRRPFPRTITMINQELETMTSLYTSVTRAAGSLLLSQLDTKTRELTTIQKNIVDIHCQFDEERKDWMKEKLELQAQLDEARWNQLEQRELATQLSAEVHTICMFLHYCFI